MPPPVDATLKDIMQQHVQVFTSMLRLGGPQPATELSVDQFTVARRPTLPSATARRRS